MTAIDHLYTSLVSAPDRMVLHYKGDVVSAGQLLDMTEQLANRMVEQGVKRGDVLAVALLEAPTSFAAILAGFKLGAIVAPFAEAQRSELPALFEIACVDRFLDLADPSTITTGPGGTNPLLEQLRATGHGGLIVFTSGSTGAPKGILHDVERVMSKFSDMRRPGFRTIQFLPLNHMGGINTFLNMVCSSAGALVIPQSRTPMSVGRAIQETRAQLLPATPGFITLLAAQGVHRSFDLSSIELVTYGADVVPEGFLERVRSAFPNARFQQTYGLSELGVLHTKSKDSGSLWVKVGGTGYEVRVVDGLLHIRTAYAMLGYLNAPQPFDADGWVNTGDAVLVDGDYFRILGRASEMIAVGGAKVVPAEIESVLIEAPNVADVVCFGERDRFLGARIVSKVLLREPEDPDALRERLRAYCLGRLERFKVPVRFEIVADWNELGGMKKKRTQ